MKKELDQYIDILKQKNMRMTSQRYAILEYLLTDEIHPTANEIYQHLKTDFPNMSIATIYNNLNFFKEAGILIELPFSDSSSRFDLSVSKHYHAICNKCGKVIDFNYPGLVEIEHAIENMTGFKVDGHQFNITGYCPICQKELDLA